MLESEPLWQEASPSVIHLAEQLIRKYHKHLQRARIGFIFRKEAQKSGGMNIYGQAKKVSEKEQVYLDFDFIIWVSKEDWERQSDSWCEALLDHELCHCAWGDHGWTMRPHDIQEFTEIVERHGYWNPDLLQFGQAGKPEQLSMQFAQDLHRMGAVLSVTPAQMSQAEG